LKVCRGATLFCFLKLSKLPKAVGTFLYPCRPKMHVFDEVHYITAATGENPTGTWTFQDEDNMRILVNIAQGCHGSTLEASVLEKSTTQFFAGHDSDSE
jgi:hypothetical protein